MLIILLDRVATRKKQTGRLRPEVDFYGHLCEDGVRPLLSAQSQNQVAFHPALLENLCWHTKPNTVTCVGSSKLT